MNPKEGEENLNEDNSDKPIASAIKQHADHILTRKKVKFESILTSFSSDEPKKTHSSK